ncbi:hypothetical protein GRI62_13080 [Erythrobacter arachoides]|uniref:Uncharacterized protein n=1 Tax=Aurantiacibacter arachoides TaxID=1850444 RepID=A0A845A1W7_9SPHN|nr:hypothetical protein [Aurantiacibacter arachoides]MXO94531.1 hypothetical protein [Aurantiacibacter arachoides]GGD62736.1 hypothetical protein GCM10011411_23750 [Aurantiacibacter arachoides]
MGQDIAIFAASLIAVAALVGLAHVMGFSRTVVIAGEADARESLLLIPGGFVPQVMALDAGGRAAIARDAAGRLALVVPHGGRMVARRLDKTAKLTVEGNSLRVIAPAFRAEPITLDLGPAAAHWAQAMPPAS